MTGRHKIGHVTVCACGKRGFASRREAKRVGRTLRSGGRLDTYRCTLTDSGLFHLGHLPAAVDQKSVV